MLFGSRYTLKVYRSIVTPLLTINYYHNLTIYQLAMFHILTHARLQVAFDVINLFPNKFHYPFYDNIL